MKSKPPVKLGITGGIGSGKSIVCQVLEVLKIPVYYADDRAKWLMNHDANLKEQIVSTFGNSSYQGGQLDRAYLASQLFADPQLLQQMNQLVHPAVQHDFDRWCQQQSSPVTAKEAALLFETGSYKLLDQTWLVTSPVDLRIQRIKIRDPQRSDAQIKDIMQKQWKEDQAMPLASRVIINDDRTLIVPQVLEALQAIN